MIVTVNGDELDVAGVVTVDDLLQSLGLGGKWVLVERNGEPVPRNDLRSTEVVAGDRFEIVRAVAGG